MSIEEFEVKDQFLGTGDTNAYTFGFKIYDPANLLIFIQDANGNILNEVTGDDTVILSGITFDPDNGGGTINLVDDLGDGFTMTIFQAMDLPNQPTEFPNKNSFSLNAIEGALDYLASLIQRVAWTAQRSMHMHDLDDIDAFDPTLPISIDSYPGGVLSVKLDGSGFEIVTTVDEVASAQGYASAANVSASASASSAASSSASATAAAASAAAANAGYRVTVGKNKNNPTVIAPAVGITPANQGREMIFVSSTSGQQPITMNPQIAAGLNVGQELVLTGCSDINQLYLAHGAGCDLNGDMIIGKSDTIGLYWDGFNWCEMFRRSET